MVGVHSYDILANPDYAEAFSYIPCNVPNRKDLIIDSDDDDEDNEAQSNLTRIALNVGYLTSEVIKDFDFDRSAMSHIKVENFERWKLNAEDEKRAC